MADEKKVTPISQLGEFGLIDRLTAGFETLNPETIKAIGDDAAVIDSGPKRTVVSTDLLVEGIHFDLMYTPLMHLGYKSVVVNLSDIYAMNAQPKQVTVSLAISSRFTVEALEELYKGIALACKNYKVDLVGGDTTSSLKGLVISVTAVGLAADDEIVYRNTARVGDLICVTGDLGAAYLGLQILEREKRIYLEHPDVQPELEDAEYLVGRQLKPEARADVIRYFKEMDLKPTAMMDLSDGLSSDILHICRQSGVGCEINESAVPLSEEAYNMAIKFNLDPITCALNGGEDYELLFTIAPEDETKIVLEETFSVIGQITAAEQGCQLITRSGTRHPLTAQGWNHFKG
ncbi:MAG TPA: thiamine-phosphate kinase [Chitinophagales bacterium]|nr:thiamine-phosphate kinase [Chitinophagales bacterium]